MIKVTVGEQKTQEVKPFPKLMISAYGRIVFMINPRRGFILQEKCEHWGVGYYSESWAMEDFTDFNEPITLQNA